MKTNGSLNQGTLKKSSYVAYAAHLRSFCQTVGGVHAISPINEPNIRVSYDSMYMSALEIANFVAVHANNCGTPISGSEPYNFSQSYINQYLSNSKAKQNTRYIFGHIYGTRPKKINSAGKEVWMTEYYVDSKTDGNNWNKALKSGKEIHDCMNADYSMYVWWYIRRSYGPIGENDQITKTSYVMAHYPRYVRPGAQRIGSTASSGEILRQLIKAEEKQLL